MSKNEQGDDEEEIDEYDENDEEDDVADSAEQAWGECPFCGVSEELDGQSFNKNYKVLKETADWLSGQKEPDIDQLVPRVERAMRAYSICKDRLDTVQATLGRYFGDGDEAAGGGPSSNGDGNGRPH